jgi:hypothetical protein
LLIATEFVGDVLEIFNIFTLKIALDKGFELRFGNLVVIHLSSSRVIDVCEFGLRTSVF